MSAINQLEEARKNKRKEEHGTFAFVVWLLSGLYLFYATEGAHFISWQSLIYFVPGSFVASAGIGGAGYTLSEVVSHACMASWLPQVAQIALAAIGGIGMLALSTFGGFWLSGLAFAAIHNHALPAW